MGVPSFEADLWDAQNTYFNTMVTISLLQPSHLNAQWLQHFRSLGECLGVTLPQPYPPMPASPEERTRDDKRPEAQQIPQEPAAARTQAQIAPGPVLP